MLGTTFGGNHLACAAGIAVLEVIMEEDLINRSQELGNYFKEELKNLLGPEVEILGKGLMIGLKFPYETGEIRKKLLYDYKIFSGSAGDKRIMRILPPLNIPK